MKKEKQDALQRVLEQAVDSSKIFGTSFSIRYNGESWSGSAGDIDNDSQYFIASVTKLFTTAVILNLRSKSVLNWDDKISDYLDADTLSGLHIMNDVSYSDIITVQHLLAHTSGLPDYFEDKPKSSISLEQDLLEGKDRHWSFQQCVEMSKSMTPLFKPGEKNKAHYSDTNFQLLGKIIENITKKSISQNYDELIINPLGLGYTYLYSDIEDTTPTAFYNRDKKLHIPRAMTSFGSDGGMVSTSAELLKFLEAFFLGRLFPQEYIEELQQWNRIFFPFKSGIGIHQFKLMWVFDPLRTVSELLGHSGLSGTLAYYSPKHNLYIAGTVNQVAYRDKSFRLALKLIQKILKNK